MPVYFPQALVDALKVLGLRDLKAHLKWNEGRLVCLRSRLCPVVSNTPFYTLVSLDSSTSRHYGGGRIELFLQLLHDTCTEGRVSICQSLSVCVGVLIGSPAAPNRTALASYHFCSAPTKRITVCF